MGRYVVRVPDVGEGMTEAEIVAWHVAVGQEIGEEDPLVDVMTDKATVELPSPVGGTVVAINGKPGEKRPVGSELVVLDVAGAGNVAEASEPATAKAPPSSRRSDARVSNSTSNVPSSTAQKGNGGAAVISLSRTAGEGAERSEAGEGVEEARQPSPSHAFGAGPSLSSSAGDGLDSHRIGAKPLASPAVRGRAWDLGVELQFVPGSGPGGRITHKDLDAFVAAGGQTALVTQPALARRVGVEEVPIIGLRRAIAEHLQQSKRQIPHFSYIEEVDVTALEKLRAQLNARYEARGHLTLLPFLMRAIVNAVADHPQVNARYDDAAGVLHRHGAVHVGVATQTEGGLLVPVVRHAEALDLWQAASELRRLTETTRAGKAARDELTGSTITITSLGALGGLAATPVINYPEVAIVGVNRIAERPMVRDGQIAIRRMMNLSSSFDHRIVDGWEAAAFIQRIKELLEQPALLFIG
jgi:2-oxoisovalerate dehydrogenase E2 component (dihydrolipoyl transacylase)